MGEQTLPQFVAGTISQRHRHDPLESTETMETSALVSCAFCGEEIEIEIDPSASRRQRYVEDCQVCCRPLVITVVFDEFGQATVSVENE